MKFALAYCAVLALLYGCLREDRAKNHGLPLVQTSVRHGFVCTPVPTPRIKPATKVEWV